MAREFMRFAARWRSWWRPVGHIAIVVAFVLTALGTPLIRKSGAEPGSAQRAGQPSTQDALTVHNALADATRVAHAHDPACSARIDDVARTNHSVNPSCSRPSEAAPTQASGPDR
jgi:hypothetical protein